MVQSRLCLSVGKADVATRPAATRQTEDSHIGSPTQPASLLMGTVIVMRQRGCCISER